MRGPLPEHWRLYRLCTLLHVTPSQLEDEPAAVLDWLLAIDDTFQEARAQASQDGGDW